VSSSNLNPFSCHGNGSQEGERSPNNVNRLGTARQLVTFTKLICEYVWGNSADNLVYKATQGIKAIPSEYACLKKIVTPSDHNLKMWQLVQSMLA